MSVKVTAENFVRAETDRMFDFILRDSQEVNVWAHNRVPTPLDHQLVIRQNRDTLYSAAIVDVSEGARVTVPDSGDRYMSVMVISQDHYVPFIFHEPGTYELTEETCGTPYIAVPARILVNPDDPDDVRKVNALQDSLRIEAVAARPFTHPSYDATSFTEVRGHLLALARDLPDYADAFGKKGDVDDVRHLLGSASAWGGFPESEAIYLSVGPESTSGEQSLTVSDVPVDAFWSITVYNADGYMDPAAPGGVVSVNSVTATPNADGSVTVRFGTGDAPNTIPTPPGWNYMVRLYQPREELRSRAWTFPTLGPADT